VARPLGGIMRAAAAVIVDAAVWAASGTLVAFTASRLPAGRFMADGRLSRLRPWEQDGRFWLRTGVQRWKRLVPALGGLLGGTSVRHLPQGPHRLQRMVAETRRAELVHWAAAVPVLAMPFWGPGWVSGVMAAYAVLANAPCIIIQRYNRGRLTRLIEHRRRQVAGRPGAPGVRQEVAM
jgi:glycosyl-4,4'-diaponeurosporenoate acyltransferase